MRVSGVSSITTSSEGTSARRAAAFAVVIVMFGLLPLSMSEPTDSTGSEDTPSPPMTTPIVATTLGTAPEIECSAQGVPLPEEAEALPAAVATSREAIITAAAACDLTALESLAGDMLTTSFGDGGVENLRSWENQGEHPLSTLLHLFDMTYATVELENGGTIDVWPGPPAMSPGPRSRRRRSTS